MRRLNRCAITLASFLMVTACGSQKPTAPTPPVASFGNAVLPGLDPEAAAHFVGTWSGSYRVTDCWGTVTGAPCNPPITGPFPIVIRLTRTGVGLEGTVTLAGRETAVIGLVDTAGTLSLSQPPNPTPSGITAFELKDWRSNLNAARDRLSGTFDYFVPGTGVNPVSNTRNQFADLARTP